MINNMRVLIAAAIIGIAIVSAFAIAGNAYKYRSITMETIVVTGLAERIFQVILLYGMEVIQRSLLIKV